MRNTATAQVITKMPTEMSSVDRLLCAACWAAAAAPAAAAAAVTGAARCCLLLTALRCGRWPLGTSSTMGEHVRPGQARDDSAEALLSLLPASWLCEARRSLLQLLRVPQTWRSAGKAVAVAGVRHGVMWLVRMTGGSAARLQGRLCTQDEGVPGGVLMCVDHREGVGTSAAYQQSVLCTTECISVDHCCALGDARLLNTVQCRPFLV